MTRLIVLALATLLLSPLAGCRRDVLLASKDAAAEDGGGSEDGGSADGGDTDAGGTEDDAGAGTDAGALCGAPCDPSECGPAPAFEEMCEDFGLVSAASDRCLRTDDGSCAWEIIRCPEDRTCPHETGCGPAPGAPAITCSDDSIGGNTGRCLLQADGSCGWQFRDCPGDACAEGSCGAESTVPNTQCADGVNVSGPSGRCLEEMASDGSTTCAWEIVACPWHEPFCR